MDEVAFSAKYGNWISIKKMMVDDSTRPEEVAAMLSGVSRTIDRKSYEILGIDTAKIDAYAQKVAGGKRKSVGSVAEIFSNLKPSEVKGELLQCIKPDIAPLPADETGSAASHEKKLPIAEQYFVKSLLEAIGYSSSPDLNVKIPKPKGRMPKK
ncbi:MAG: DUF2666 family protein [Candidatus Micrarchaeota archaeon]|nr:DUF2666 family protein [Candidatus Micrarchaeota archaeon]